MRPLPSYINRVYELKDSEGVPLIAKFYRPGRWSNGSLLDEHEFLLDCAESELPVVAPEILSSGTTLGLVDDIHFAVFPKRAGRQFDVEDENGFERVGALLARIHTVGARGSAKNRLTLNPANTTHHYVQELETVIIDKWKKPYIEICTRIIELVTPLFEGVRNIRIHGDFHNGNILNRMEQGLAVIDFDDMMNGPAVQDFWLLLPDHYPACRPQVDMMLQGYTRFRDFDFATLPLIEGLRAMRMIYFTAWIAMQRNDGLFNRTFADWGSDSFWSREVNDLRSQYANIMDSLEQREWQ